MNLRKEDQASAAPVKQKYDVEWHERFSMIMLVIVKRSSGTNEDQSLGSLTFFKNEEAEARRWIDKIKELNE